MKITKTSEDVDRFKREKKIANRGCNKCPCCGSKKVKKGFPTIWREDAGGFFHYYSRHMKKDNYECEKCGAEWESDPYEWM